MGNSLNCCPASKSIEVYGHQGRLLRYSRPVKASKLMKEHPNHVIVYSVISTRRTNDRMGKAPKNHVRIRVVRPGDELRIGKVYFLVKIPEQYTAKFAKYFHRQSPSATPSRSKHSSPSTSPLSIYSSPPGSPIPFYTSPSASPLSTAVPARSFYSGTASPLILYTRSPLSGSTPEITRPANQQPLRNSAPPNTSRSPARPKTPINQDVMRSIVNKHFQRDLNRSMRSPGRPSTPIHQRTNLQFQRDQNKLMLSPRRPGTPIQETAYQESQWNQSRSAQSPARSSTPRTRDTLANILLQSHEEKGSSPNHHHSNKMDTSTQDTLRTILQQQHWGSTSPYFKKSPSKSPRRAIKAGTGKASRPRRGALRSPSHHKAAVLKSPGRSVHKPAVVNEDDNAPWLATKPTRRVGSNEAASFQARTPPGAPPAIIGGSFSRRRMLPRLLRPRSIRGAWTPALQSISESPEKGTVQGLLKSPTPGFTPLHLWKVSPAHGSR